ncbi:MAG: NAD-dependent epimerase/dehydratase family protein [Nanoarchaeota archaeon]
MTISERYFVNENTDIKGVMSVIDRNSIRMAIVADAQRTLIGVVTDGDIRRAILRGFSIHDPISMILNKNPFFATVDTPTQVLFEQFRKERYFGIPVVDENRRVIDLAFPDSGSFSFLSKSVKKSRPMEKILVIGGGGYIGSTLVRRLLKQNYAVRVLDKFLYGEQSLVDLRDNPKLEIVSGDTRHLEELSQCIQDVDAVVHLAELVGDHACSLNTKVTQDINYLATFLVASVCKHYQVNRLVYTSSCSVYGGSEGTALLSEHSDLNPISLYAKMKVNSEQALLSMADENFAPTILRLATVYGWSNRPRFDLVVNTLTAKALQEGKITIFGGDQWRPNVHVADVAKAILLVLEAPFETVANQTFNVGSEDQNYTITQLGNLIKEQIPTATLTISSEVHDKRNYRVAFSKIRDKLNFKPDFQIIDAVAEISKAFQENKVGDYLNSVYHNHKFLQKELPQN